ncbi:hypothetical protein [Amycolatopsis sp. H20-H5]|uniref:hypothetical protein n=1 Tax=Amycolatopsis sp. H20-H5 TaxID=3046309 RepID=UPI002DB57B0E|nr:hypothetical protein [Amycolatopsis sp. H20-H5]MEC3979500.1 hypothetical protein [Amycolatopsis sp. H20-H5]
MYHHPIITGELLEATTQALAVHTGVFLIGDDHLVCTVVVTAARENGSLPPLSTHMSWLPRSISLQHGAKASRRAPAIRLKRHSLGGTPDVIVTTYLGRPDPAFDLATASIVDFWFNPGALRGPG